MVNRDAIEAEVRERIAEVQARIDGQSEGHKRWNRLEEAMDILCEDAINLLDDVGRYDQANDISSMLAAHERYDALLAIFRGDKALATESRAADREEAYERSRRFLEAIAPIAAIEVKNRPF
jgi:hypothetical protein